METLAVQLIIDYDDEELLCWLSANFNRYEYNVLPTVVQYVDLEEN